MAPTFLPHAVLMLLFQYELVQFGKTAQPYRPSVVKLRILGKVALFEGGLIILHGACYILPAVKGEHLKDSLLLTSSHFF